MPIETVLSDVSNDLSTVKATKELIRPYVIKTPVRRLHWLEDYVGYPVYAKLESQQITGSFKFRGALSKLLKHNQDKTFIAASAGNHGLAVACAAYLLGKEANICIPVSASPLKKEKIIKYGAGLIEHGSSVEEATDYALKLARENGWTYVSPYNDPDIVLGQGTLWQELLEEYPDIETIISPIGGGGLISGASFAAKESGRTINIIGCEPENYQSMKASFDAGKIVNVLRRSTFADGLATNIEKNSLTFQIIQKNISHIETINEEDIAASVIALLNRESLLAEGAGAISVMACIRMAQKGLITGPVGIAICGGNIHHTTLSRLQAVPIQDKVCQRILDRRGKKAQETAIHKIYSTANLTAQEQDNGSLQTDFAKLADKMKERAERTENSLSDYQQYCQDENLCFSDTANQLVQTVLDTSKDLIKKTKNNLLATKESSIENLIKAEINLRAFSQIISAAQNCLNWRSPVYAQSMVPQFFFLGAQDSGDVNYERYGFEELRRIERQLMNVMNLPADKYACTVVNSGMAAYSLVEGYLIRHILKPGHTVAMSPYIYFESDEQLKGFDWLDIKQVDSYDTDQFINHIENTAPKAVFCDPLANTTEQRMMDIPKTLKYFSDKKDSPCFIIDGSMMPCAMSDSIKNFGYSDKLFYIESCSKYLQFGMDMSMAGVVIHSAELKPYMDRIRRNMGAALTENGALLFPEYDRQMFMQRMHRIEQNARSLSLSLHQRKNVTDYMRVVHPSLTEHPDHQIATALGRFGGCVTFKIQSETEDHKDQLEALIDIILFEAKRRKLPITKGVSFGFSFNRLCAAASMAENDPPFLRLSVGDHPNIITEDIADCIESACVYMLDLKTQENNYRTTQEKM